MSIAAKTEKSSTPKGSRTPMAILVGDVRDVGHLTYVAGELVAANALDALFCSVRGLEIVHEGRIVKTFGDGFMAVFDDALAAFRFATALLQSLSEKPIPDAQNKLEMCLGLHHGDVLETSTSYGAEFIGPPVRTAAHLSSMARPGEILMSNAFRMALPLVQQPPATVETVEVKGEGGLQVFRFNPLLENRRLQIERVHWSERNISDRPLIVTGCALSPDPE